MDKSDVCVSIFRNGTLCKEEYTAKWVILINRMLRETPISTTKGEKS